MAVSHNQKERRMDITIILLVAIVSATLGFFTASIIAWLTMDKWVKAITKNMEVMTNEYGSHVHPKISNVRIQADVQRIQNKV
jgi:hypothetical protein